MKIIVAIIGALGGIVTAWITVKYLDGKKERSEHVTHELSGLKTTH
jgi:hypothetical protein